MNFSLPIPKRNLAQAEANHAQSLWILWLTVSLSVVVGCSHHDEHATEAEKPPESRVKHDTNGNTVITLKPENRQAMGLQTVSLAAAQWSPEIRGFGRVMDISALAGLLAELETANVALNFS